MVSGVIFLPEKSKQKNVKHKHKHILNGQRNKIYTTLTVIKIL